MNYESCQLCPRKCRVNRTQTTGYCKSGSAVKVARAALHMWEEPCISGANGSGTVFFSGCTLGCCFCQNYQISQEGFGKEISIRQLSDLFLRLQDQGAHNINLVTATQFLPSIIKALDLVKHRLTIPVVYNSGGYERTETIDRLNGYVDIWLPDFKYYNNDLAKRYSNAADYFETASQAIARMIEKTGEPVFDCQSSGQPLMKKGVIIRHMVLPGCKADSFALLHWISENLPKGRYYISLMSQYTPFYHSKDFPEINRRITSYEYQKVVDLALVLGLDQGFMQEKSSAKEEYTPPFNLEGVQ